MKSVCIVLGVLLSLGLSNAAMASTAGATSPQKKADSEPASPFINGHYVLQSDMHMNGYHSNSPTVLIVDKGSHSTYVLQLQKSGDKEQIERVLTVSNAIGSVDKPTPSGRYWIAKKQMYPVWIPTKEIDPKQKPVPPYNQTHKNPLGVAALFLNTDELALHGTNTPKLIRTSVSHGCIRHSNADIERIYGMVKVGTPVYVVRQFKGTVLKSSDFEESSSKHGGKGSSHHNGTVHHTRHHGK